jgi:hypothetical protein
MIKLNPDVDDSEFLERATGAKMTEPSNEGDTSDRLNEIENRLKLIDIDKAKALCRTESQKISAAVERDGFENWAKDFYGGEWKSRLSDRFSPDVAAKYCEDRCAEVLELLSRNGRGAVENDAANANARSYLLIERELETNGHRATHAR